MLQRNPPLVSLLCSALRIVIDVWGSPNEKKSNPRLTIQQVDKTYLTQSF